jgi:DNA polymerase-2
MIPTDCESRSPGTIDGEGFIVHAYVDARRSRVHLLGRLADGRSFAASKPVPGQNACVRIGDVGRAEAALASAGMSANFEATSLLSFDGCPCARVSAAGRSLNSRALSVLAKVGVEVIGADEKGAQAFLSRNGIRGGVRISGSWRPGRGVDVVFPDAAITPADTARAPLSVLSLDIETEEPSGFIRAVGLALAPLGPDCKPLRFRRKALLFAGPWGGSEPPDRWISVFTDEASLLRALVAAIRELDPDIVTGWNVIDFDFPRLAAAFSQRRVPFSLGRSLEAGAFFPAERDDAANDGDGSGRLRSASVFLPGRQVLDALRLVRTGHHAFESYALDAVARELLGVGKTVRAEGLEKLAELDRLYAGDSLSFCRYCLNDAELVLDILEKENILHHTVERAALTGVGVDKAWTSVASFERIYGAGLYARGVLEPNMPAGRDVSGAAGGTVLEPMAGIFSRVAVFDFRSLYPSLIRTFNIDPLSYERALPRADDGIARGDDAFIVAPNGARFVRDRGILPSLIDEYFSERLKAIERGDEASAYVYKILMNSFYGVLGAGNCRYARTELAGAITSFGKVCLHFARDYFTALGFRVLYGDTDSVFVELADAGAETLSALADGLNESLSDLIRKDYGLESHIAIRFEKLYARFFIPRLRSLGARKDPGTGGGIELSGNDDENRGRAKGYAGLLLRDDGSSEVEIKGMEAARSDYTPLARDFQRGLLGILFREDGTLGAEEFLRAEVLSLYRGERDGALAFKKRLRRDPDSYEASTPPQVKVARDLGIRRRGATVEYVITVNGPEAVSLRKSPIDYGWYAESQILPVARSAGAAAGFDADSIVATLHADGQLEFPW